jgi:hypothetical protein
MNIPTSPLSRRAKNVLTALALLLAAELLIFVVPTSDTQRPSDVVAVLGGNGFNARVQTGFEIARLNRAGLLLISVKNDSYCPKSGPAGVTMRCFRPTPFSTRGEAQYVAEQAHLVHAKSLSVVATADQLVRVRGRVSRCWHSQLSVVEAPASALSVLKLIPYQNGGYLKQELWQRPC